MAGHIGQFEQKIDKLINKNFANVMFGFVLQDAESGKILYAKEANTAFVPASATKLFVAAAALHKLTPKFRFQTKVKYEKNKVKNGILAGSIAIEFKGDPSFTSASLKKLVQSIKKANITTITGNLILDDTYFQGSSIGSGWSNDDTPWYYAGPVSAIILDGNQVNIAIKPAKKLGQLATVHFADRNKRYFNLAAAVKTVTWKESENLCQLQVAMDNTNNIKLTGCWPIGGGVSNLKLAIQNNRKFIQDVIKDAFINEKIQLKGKIIYSKAQANMNTLAVHSSSPLRQLLLKLLGRSNNTYAEALTKTLGAKVYHRGSFQAGALAIKDILQKPTGINFDAMNLVDGSGLSRYTLITPNQFSRLLYTMYHSPELKAPYMQALAYARTKGTLRARNVSFDKYANIKAKTGWMSGVSALSGYITTRSNKTLIFTMLVNNTLLPKSRIKQIEDKLCKVIVNYAT